MTMALPSCVRLHRSVIRHRLVAALLVVAQALATLSWLWYSLI